MQGTATANTRISYASNGIWANNCCTSATGNLSVSNTTIQKSSSQDLFSQYVPTTIGASTFDTTSNYEDVYINTPGGGTVSVSSSTFKNAATFGLQVSGATNPTIQNNTFTTNGLGTTKYPAALLTGLNVVPAATSLPSAVISGFNGTGNGVDLVGIDGTISAGGLTWQAPGSSVLGFTLERNGNLVLSGSSLTIPAGSVSKGNATLVVQNGATLTVGDTSGGATFTSPRDDVGFSTSAPALATCGSWLNPYGTCTPGASDWTGLSFSGSGSLTVQGTAAKNSFINYATTPITFNNSTAVGSLSVTNTTINYAWSTGIYAQNFASATLGAYLAPLVMSNVSNGNGIYTNAPGSSTLNLNYVKVTGVAKAYAVNMNSNITVTCATITGNAGGGLQFNGTSGGITSSNLFKNTSTGIYDLDFNSTQTSPSLNATNDWWNNSVSPYLPVTGQVGGGPVTTSPALSSASTCAP